MIPLRDRPATPIFARLIGAAFFLIGLGLASLAAFIAWKQLESLGSIEKVAAVLCLFMLPIAWFCTSTGWRLALNKPNRYGSIIRPWAWRTLSAIFLLLAITIVVFASMQAKLMTAWPALGAVGFAVLCFWRARMLARLAKSAPP